MKAYDYWLDELSLKEYATQINYLRYFHRYLEARGWTPEELYERQRVVLMDGDPRSNREVVLDLSRYIRDMVKEGYAAGTAVKAGHAVVSFMAANGLDFPLRAGDLPRVVMSGSRVALVGEIRELLDLMGVGTVTGTVTGRWSWCRRTWVSGTVMLDGWISLMWRVPG